MNDAADAPNSEWIAGKYRLIRMIGQGGMGTVWEGQHITLGTKVAIKMIEHDLAENHEARNRFDKEARAAATLSSRYVVTVFDHGVMPDGRPFIVMEYLRGQTLEERAATNHRLPLVEVARIIDQVARGLSKAHELGIVHRDLKPENIFLTESPDEDETVAKIVDFGIAKFIEGTPLSQPSSTRSGTILGTPVYMSPEQARGLRDIDHRSDLWALGVIAYRCAVGTLPFQGEAVGDIVVNICTKDPVLPSTLVPSLPKAFDDWFRRCVARDREMRFDSAKELASSLWAASGSSPPQSFATDLLNPHLVESRTNASHSSIESATTQVATTNPPGRSRMSRGVLGGTLVLLGACASLLVGWWYSSASLSEPMAAEASHPYFPEEIQIVNMIAPAANSEEEASISLPESMASNAAASDAPSSSRPKIRPPQASAVQTASRGPSRTLPPSTTTIDLGY